jgi:hypothetical protein
VALGCLGGEADVFDGWFGHERCLAGLGG